MISQLITDLGLAVNAPPFSFWFLIAEIGLEGGKPETPMSLSPLP
jgi:hypothetical protein